MILEKQCPMCEGIHKMTLTKDEGLAFERWECEGLLIQDCFPSFNPMEREFIKTGYCPDCQSVLFGTDFQSNRIKKGDE